MGYWVPLGIYLWERLYGGNVDGKTCILFVGNGFIRSGTSDDRRGALNGIRPTCT